MGPTLSKKEIASQIKELRAKIGDAKDSIKAEFRSFRKVSKKFVKATAEYKKAKAAYDKKPKAKQERKLDAALELFYQANDDYKAVYSVINSYFDTVEQGYNEICDLLEVRGSHRKMEKVSLEFEKYREKLERKLSLMSEGVPELVEDEEEETPEVEEEVVEEPAPAPAPTPVAAVAVSPVSINPVVIDVSATVDSVVETTIAKLNAHLDKKLREYFDNLVLPTVEGAPTTTVIKEVVKETVAPVH